MSSANHRPVALVTGPTAGIGRVFSLRLAERGYDLVLVARDRDRLEALAAELAGAHGAESEVLVADLSDRAGMALVEDRLADESRPVDLLVNNAGFGLKRRFLDNSVEQEQAALDILVTAVMRLTHAALGPMTARGSGGIINVASVAAYQPRGSYSAAKSWVTTFGAWASQEYGPKGVHLMTLCPGFTRTEFHERMDVRRDAVPRPLWLDVDRVVDEALADWDAGKKLSIPSKRYKLIAGGEPTRAGRCAPPVPGPGSPLTRSPERHQVGCGPPNGTSTRGGPTPETSRRIHSSRSRSIADAGRRTTHSQRPPASPANTARSTSTSAHDVETAHSGTDWLPIRSRTGGRPAPSSEPGSRWGVPAQRAPSPTPDSSLTTNTSTGPSRALVPELQVSVARPRPASATTAKSLTVQPGLIGQGRYVGKSPAAASASTNASYDGASARSRGGVAPCSGQVQPPSSVPSSVARTGSGQRGHSGLERHGSTVVVRGRRGSSVPAQHHGRLALVAEHGDRGGVEPQVPTVGDRQLQPPGGQRAQRVAVPEDQHPAVGGPAAGDDAVEPVGDLVAVSPPGTGPVQIVQSG